MKTITQNGKKIERLEDLETGQVVVKSEHTIEDLPDNIKIGELVLIPKLTWCDMVKALSKVRIADAYRWVYQQTGWDLEECKEFVDKLNSTGWARVAGGWVQEKQWTPVHKKLPLPLKEVLFKNKFEVVILGYHDGRDWFESPYEGEASFVSDIVEWTNIP